jgi:hypothetical protein
MPIQQIAECLIQLYNARDRTKAILYELTGMSDILRGQTSPVETKGAQDLKARFATRRISPKRVCQMRPASNRPSMPPKMRRKLDPPPFPRSEYAGNSAASHAGMRT